MTIPTQAARRTFPPSRLANLLQSTFAPKAGQRICYSIDLPEASGIKDFAFLKNPGTADSKECGEVFSMTSPRRRAG
jgi:hypothetical protein